MRSVQLTPVRRELLLTQATQLISISERHGQDHLAPPLAQGASEAARLRVIAQAECAIRPEKEAVYPLDETVIDKMPTTLEIHDAIIIATGLVLQEALNKQVIVITRDESMITAGLITTLW